MEFVSKEEAIKAAIEGADNWDGGCNVSRSSYIREAVQSLNSRFNTTTTAYHQGFEEGYSEGRTDTIVAFENSIDEIIKKAGLMQGTLYNIRDVYVNKKDVLALLEECKKLGQKVEKNLICGGAQTQAEHDFEREC